MPFQFLQIHRILLLCGAGLTVSRSVFPGTFTPHIVVNYALFLAFYRCIQRSAVLLHVIRELLMEMCYINFSPVKETKFIVIVSVYKCDIRSISTVSHVVQPGLFLIRLLIFSLSMTAGLSQYSWHCRFQVPFLNLANKLILANIPSA